MADQSSKMAATMIRSRRKAINEDPDQTDYIKALHRVHIYLLVIFYQNKVF